ncbi:RagB/SusD family nutrient uptake outer membrane protein [Chitinophaga sp. HK235]|uniref:RagB/SusD family nutrient uptake outer membrane protein n=1 Tax=Chitinophaga sp. HK235 TaxID=2952571 RepID=UPI001BA504B5|nr:RagB/SusD family nutrient uptake outer membrane protein [Chitinophaga sp. HK235]
MKRIFYLLLTGATIITTPGCKKFLDIKPKGYTIPEFYEDYQKLLSNASLIRATAAYPSYITDDVLAGEDNDVTKQAAFAGYSVFKKSLYTFKNGQTFEPSDSDPFWEPAYNHIYTYNTVINNILNVPDGTAQDKKRLRAEAQVGRAFEYLSLVNVYAEHYDAATAATALGVPLVLSEDINLPYERKSVAEVYAQIKKDLDEALPNLPDNVPNNFKPMKSVGYAFLSRMNLYMGDYKAALANANEALKLNSFLLDYKIYTNKNGTWGRVCTLSDSTAFPDGNKNKESVWIRYGSSSSSHVFSEVYASTDLINAYKKDLPAGATDKRFALFFCHGKSNFGGGIVSFPGRELWAPYVEFNLGFATPELYLIAAECEARIGDPARAIQLMNTLRDSRIENNQPLVANTSDDALRLVLEERRREMPFMGSTRLIDLKRLNKDPRFAKTITHTQGVQTFTLPPNDKRYILPVPPKVLAVNPNIPQYER